VTFALNKRRCLYQDVDLPAGLPEVTILFTNPYQP
jgi:hypothetical protein